MKVYNYKYQTKQWLPQHDYNLYDFGARMYDPVLARFTTPDPLMQFNNPYLAMGANPVSMVDPTGMWAGGGYNDDIAAAQEKAMYGRKSSGSGSLSKIIVDGLQINSGSSGLLNNIAMNQMQNGLSITDPSQVAFTLSSLQTLNPDKKGEKLTLSTWGSKYSLQKLQFEIEDAAMEASGKQTATFPNGKVYTVGSPVEVEGNDATAQGGGEHHGIIHSGHQALFFPKMVGESMEAIGGSFRIRNGAYNGNAFSLKHYPSGWKGGSIAKIKTFSMHGVGGLLAKGALGIGVLLDLKGVMIYKDDPDSPNAVHPGKAGLNAAAGYFGFKINPIAGALYFGVDAFYPGGWVGYGNNYNSLQNANSAIIPGFITAPYGALKQ